MDTQKERRQKEAILRKLIDLKTDIQEAKREAHEAKFEVKRLAQRVEDVRMEGFDERRKLENKIKRSIWEVLEMTIGNRKKIEEVSRRAEDTSTRFDKIESIVTWTLRGIIGLFIATLVGAICKLVFGV